MIVKAIVPRHFSIIVFMLTQIAIDLEVLWDIMRGEMLHQFWHSFVGMTIAAAACCLVGKATSQFVKGIWNRVARRCSDANLLLDERTTWTASFTGAFIGAYSHLILDSMYHAGMQPLAPWRNGNPLFGFVCPTTIELACVVSGVVGLGVFLMRERRKRRGQPPPAR